MHRLLKRQLNRFNVIESELEPNTLALINAVDTAYVQNDKDHKLLEHALELLSSELVEQNSLLKEQLATLGSTFDSIKEGLITVDGNGEVSHFNQSALTILMLDENKLKHGGNDYLYRKISSIASTPIEIVSVFEHINSDPSCVVNGTVELVKGAILEYYSRPKSINGEILGRVWCIRDVTALKRQQDQISFQAHHDMLTFLPNRLSITEAIDVALTQRKHYTAILYIDLDNFKEVNDLHGHHIGDLLLCAASKAIMRSLRKRDQLARLGGDEFLVLIEDVSNKDEVDQKVRSIMAEMSRPFNCGGVEILVTMSIGVHIGDDDEDTTEDYIRKADMAMYSAKTKGRNTWEFFQSDLEDAVRRRASINQRLKNALSRKELTLFYQPQINSSDKTIYGFEALVRWHCPIEGLIPPADFIPVAEDSQLIIIIGNWIIEEACKQLAIWNQSNPELRLSINLSVKQLQEPTLITTLSKAIQRHKVVSNTLEVEITESMVVEDIDRVIMVLNQIRDLGVTIAIDDFGTGYSSLNYLRQLPINTLKIDQSFVKDVHSSEAGSAIITSIIQLAHGLNLRVIAEGVEDKKTYHFLCEADCDVIQGYYFGKPAAPEKMNSLLKDELVFGRCVKAS